ncbi:MAG TPA: MFS transporter [Hyphomonas sp.]|nr:MFS transporter [Hyphomonas sp.]
MTETPLTPGQDEEAMIAAARLGARAPATGGAMDRPGWSWAWFEFARNPYYILVVIYIFAPYFAREIVGGNLIASGALDGLDPEQARAIAGAKGQATVAAVTKWAGLAAALTAPFLGAAFDRGLRRKPFLLAMIGVISVASFSLWWAVPGNAGLSVGAVMGLLVIAYVAFTYSEVGHNSMLADAARPEALPAISGLGLALGNAAAVILFAGLVFMFALPAAIHWPFREPLFGIDTSKFEHLRLAGPVAAVWLLATIAPFFLYSRDTGVKGTPVIPAIRDGVKGVLATIRRATEHREAFKFLIARTLYADGMTALLTIGAVYVSLFLGWNVIELTFYAIWASAWAVVGGVFGGWLDGKLGPKNALIVELVAIVLILVFGLSITQKSLFFGLIENRDMWNAPFLTTLSDWVYMFQGTLIAVFATANIASSRSMLVHIAPPNMRGEFFGLFAIAGTVTVWMGPLLIEVFTDVSKSQRIGISAIALLFFAGLAVLLTVKSEKRPAS